MLGDRDIPRVIQIQDRHMQALDDGLFLYEATFRPIRDLKGTLATPVQPSDIRQQSLGNCYLLAALGSILEKNPSFLQEIMRVNENGQVEVRLQDARTQQHYTYILEPTKVIHPVMNKHTHDAIYLLEKAYALHRHLTENLTPNEEVKLIIRELRANNFDLVKAQEILKKKYYIEIEKEGLEYIKNDYRLTYNDCLRGGYSNDVFVALGIPAGKISLNIGEGLIFYVKNFVEEIYNYEEGRGRDYALSAKSKEILAEMFGDLDSQLTQEFLRVAYHNNHLLMAAGILESHFQDKSTQDEVKPYDKKSKRAEIIELFTNIVGLSEEVKKAIQVYFSKHIPLPKGMRQYSADQEAFYKMIANKLELGDHVALTSSPVVSRKKNLTNKENIVNHNNYSGEKKAKGLAGSHVYHVVGTREEDGIKYIRLRNPWGSYTRSYEKRKKMIDGEEREVLHSIESPKQNRPAFLRFMGAQLAQDNGYFEIELSDLKRFDNVAFTDAEPSQPKSSKKP